jgi:hypothetical protein
MFSACRMRGGETGWRPDCSTLRQLTRNGEIETTDTLRQIDRHSIRILLVIAGGALLLRLLPLLRSGDWWSVLDDSHGYLALAHGMLSGCGFARLINGACRPTELYRLPGYPLFVLMMPSLRATVFVQALLAALTCLMVGWFTYIGWGLTAGIIAETLLALDIPSIVASSTIMSDSLFQTLLTSAVLLQLAAIWPRSANRNSFWLFLSATVLLACTVLIRAIAIVVPLLAAVPVMLLPGVKFNKRIGFFLLMTAIPCSVIAGWTIRNHARTGTWTFTTEGAYNLYYYTTAGVLWDLHGDDLTNLQHQLAMEVGANSADEFVSKPQQSEMVKRSFAVLFGHPIATIAMTLRCFAWLAIVPDRANLNGFLGTNGRSSVFLVASENIGLRIKEMLRSPLLTAFVLIQIPLVVLTWIGVSLSLIFIRQQEGRMIPMMLVPLGAALVMLLVGSGPWAIARFRVPAMPFLAMLAGIGWSVACPGTSWGRRCDSEQIADDTD